MTMNTGGFPKVVDRSVRYIKDGKRRIMTDSGVMSIPAALSKQLFGKIKGGKYSEKQA